MQAPQDAYQAIRPATAAATLLLIAFLFTPSAAKAFWLFGSPAAASGNTPIVHDSSIALLQAATNPDPNPVKGVDNASLVGGSALLSDSGPSGTIADILDNPTNDQISLYVVRPGDSLADIANMYDVSVNTIIWANDLKSAKDVHVGDTLVILPVSGLKHTIASGETLASLAKKYGANASEIAQFNGFDDSAALDVGSVIIIPGGELATPTVTVKTKSKSSSKIPPEPLHGAGGPSIPGYFIDPLPGAILTQGLHGNNAVDLGKPTGTPILAAANGTVIVSKANGAWNGGYGSYVVISHTNGTQTLYAHMSRNIVTQGQQVTQSQVIGYVGRTGEATGPHLHYEVRGAKNPLGACTLNASCNL